MKTEIENLFDEDLLLPNLKGAAYFILLYEHVEDSVISAVKECYSIPCVLDGKMPFCPGYSEYCFYMMARFSKKKSRN